MPMTDECLWIGSTRYIATEPHHMSRPGIFTDFPLGRGGGVPVVVFHSLPAGTSQSPWQSHSQSASSIKLCCALTKFGKGHMPCGSLGQPVMPVNGVTPSFIMRRICSSALDVQDKTVGRELSSGEEGQGKPSRLPWICRFVANGES